MFLSTLHQPKDAFFVKNLIVVDSKDIVGIVPERGGEASVCAGGVPQIPIAVHDLNVSVVFADRRRRSIGRTIINYYHMETEAAFIGALQAPQTLQRLFTSVVNWSNYFNLYH